ncbi:MAG: 16S rRNA (adenine1518-N6/adenine1519-N6)-dimethyltransferase [Woeseiaceae bacterium]|jgi:16S rRNA (adenine1518-N6/adenine1519-N6)-dimethyltransferase
MTGHQARKRFGQHFLTSDEIIQQIVHAVSPQQGDTIVEIGPGQGAITTPLAQLATTLHAIEFDRDLVPRLIRRYADNNNVRIHEADALTFDFASLGDRLRIVGNLPYNISTPLLFHLLRFRDSIEDMHFMLQKEVVDRMAAQPGNKSYGRLTIMLGCALEVVPLFDVPREAFSPAPKIVSSVVRMRPIPQPDFRIHDTAAFESLVKLAFSRRRKTLRNALQGMATVADIEAVGLDPTIRPEQVSIANWVALANKISVGAS